MLKTAFVATTSLAFGTMLGALGALTLLIVIADEDEEYFDSLIKVIKN